MLLRVNDCDDVRVEDSEAVRVAVLLRVLVTLPVIVWDRLLLGLGVIDRLLVCVCVCDGDCVPLGVREALCVLVSLEVLDIVTLCDSVALLEGDRICEVVRDRVADPVPERVPVLLGVDVTDAVRVRERVTVAVNDAVCVCD